MIPDMSWALDTWQGYSHDPNDFIGHMFGMCTLWQEAVFMCSIWHEVVTTNTWRANIAMVSVSKQCIFCLPNIS